jgi:RNA polymerase sigma-70 factor (ECF subfamily)
MHADSNRLVAAAREGDRGAAEELVNLNYQRIYAFLRRLSGNEAEAADLTQRTFSRIWCALDTFANRSSMSSWFHGIAYHVYVDWRRANHRLEPRSDEWWGDRPSTEALPDQLATKADSDAAVYSAVEQLDADLRETVHLHYYQELTIEETAHVMAVATSTVKYRLRRALEQLRKRVNDEPQMPARR